ncbi:MAG: WD40 repeat domain-containing protein, partial [Atribacterota bacterium]
MLDKRKKYILFITFSILLFISSVSYLASASTFSYNISKSEVLHDPNDDINFIDFNNAGNKLAAGTANGHAYIYNTWNWYLVKDIYQISGESEAVKYNPDDTFLAVGHGSDMSIFNTSDWSKEAILENASVKIEAIDFNNDGSLLVGGSLDENVYIYNTSDWTLQETLTDAG